MQQLRIPTARQIVPTEDQRSVAGPSSLNAPTIPSQDLIAPRRFLHARIAVALALPIALMLFALSMGKHLDHDEHQFIAPGALFARDALLPYRDYPYFHTPNLLFVYSFIDRFSNHLLLTARLLSVACATALVTIVALFVHRLFACFRPATQRMAALAATLVLVFNPVFYATTGRAWNHDVPTLIALLSLLALWRGLDRNKERWIALAGFGLGLAVGTRLTFAPLWLAFAVTLVRGKDRSLRRILILSAAAAIALLPTAWLFYLAPRQFIFGNFTYPMLNTEIRRISGFPRAMSAIGKVKYLFTDLLVQPGNLLLLAGAVASLIGLHRDRSIEPHPHRSKVISITWVIAMLLVGSFAPTPLFPQYFFEPLPFAVILIALVAADARKTTAQARPWLRTLGTCAVLAFLPGVGSLRYLAGLAHPREWTPVRIHRLGDTVARLAGRNNRVLTFAPIIPLEGGCKTYPEFASGPFATRVADLVRDEDEQLFKEIDADDMTELLAARPPAAILVGSERGLDRILLELAHQLDFHAAILNDCQPAVDPLRLWIHTSPRVFPGAGLTQ